MFLSEWREFPSAPCLAGKKKNLMTARVSMLLKSRASLTCFRACFLPGRVKDLSAPRHSVGSLLYLTDIVGHFPPLESEGRRCQNTVLFCRPKAVCEENT